MIDNKTNDDNIKIYVVCHKPTYVPDNPYLYPIQVGTALASQRMDGMLHDDEGENISDRNKTYCELTAQYWAWKNEEADYYGFFHYRRYFSFDTELQQNDGWGNVSYDRISTTALNELKLQPEIMRKLIKNYDVIMVKGRKYAPEQAGGIQTDVYHEYGLVPFQHREDLDITLNVLKSKYPQFAQAADAYMSSDTAYECNMFIMKRSIYMDYCSWLFDILFEAEKKIDTSLYSIEEYRVMGYLAERLCGVYCTYLKTKEDVRYCELPKALFQDTEPLKKISPISKTAVPIVLSANNRFAPFLDIMIRSIVANASEMRTYDIIVLYNDISEKNQKLIKTVSEGKSNISIRFIKVSGYFDTSEFFVDQHLSVETYYRLIIPELMPNYHKIMYLDCDMVADYDVADLYDKDLNGKVIAAARDIDVAGQVNLDKNEWKSYATDTLGLNSPFDYFQAGVLIIDLDELRKITSSETMIRMAMEHSYRCHDQDIMNIICKNRVIYIPQAWNTLMDWQEHGRSRMDILKMSPRALYDEYMQARQKPYIIHYAGYQKPWDVVDCDFSEYFWKYARLSPWYEVILRGIKRCFRDEVYQQSAGCQQPDVDRQGYSETGLKKISAYFLPYGSRRREWIKRIYWKFMMK